MGDLTLQKLLCECHTNTFCDGCGKSLRGKYAGDAGDAAVLVFETGKAHHGKLYCTDCGEDIEV